VKWAISVENGARLPHFPIKVSQRSERAILTELPVITRREFVAGTGMLVGGAAVLSAFGVGIVPALAQTPTPADLAVEGPLGDMVMGKADAPVTIIEYASMTCGHCANFSEKTFPELKKRYIDTGKVKYILREFPLDPLAAAGFMLARCAGNDKYYPLVEALFAQQKQWAVQKPIEPLMAIAKQAGFTQESFNACLSNQKVLEGIEATRARASEKLGVNSTPTFFINGKVFRGDMSIETMEKEIQPYLKS
jgi:protein-disulfide isomerase